MGIDIIESKPSSKPIIAKNPKLYYQNDSGDWIEIVGVSSMQTCDIDSLTLCNNKLYGKAIPGGKD